MEYRHFAQACVRIGAGMLIGVMLTTAPRAFADELSSSEPPTLVSKQTNGLAAYTVPSSPSTGLPAERLHAVASQTNSATQTQLPVSVNRSATQSFLYGVAGKADDVVTSALNMIGVRYRWGGNTPDSGLDCSGFVRYVFRDTLGLVLPRRAEDMSHVGEKVSVSDLKPGDLVFFNTVRRTISHVGIYIGDNKFVHSPSTGSTIRVDELDNLYWEKHFRGARRIETDYTPGTTSDLHRHLNVIVTRDGMRSSVTP